jgi:hypothetical protein
MKTAVSMGKQRGRGFAGSTALLNGTEGGEEIAMTW